MTRKSILLGLATLLLLAGSLAAALVMMVRHERSFYARVALPPGPARQRDSEIFQGKCFQLMNGILQKDPEWEERFTERQINSYFAENFLRSGVSEQMLPDGISEPRVAIEANRIRLGFRYGKEPWSTIVSFDLKVWLPKEPNVVCIELQGLHAGGLPISAQSLLERVFEVARRQNIEVSWYRHEGSPVAVLHFQAGQPRPTVILERLELHEGMMVIGGHSNDPKPLQAMLIPQGPLKPISE